MQDGLIMARKSYGTSEVKFQKWIKDGRGSGRGIEYKPWITVRDLPSEGRSHRIFGHKSQRTHHLLSDLELAVFLLLEKLLNPQRLKHSIHRIRVKTGLEFGE